MRKLLIALLFVSALPLIGQPINPISRRVRGFAATPSTCNFSASVVDFGVNTTTNTFYICTSLGWLGMGSGAGTVTTLSVVSANGFAGSVANPTTTPAITLSTTVTGLVKGNGTAISAASPGTDYVVPAGNVATASASDHSITSCGANTWANGLSTTWVLNCVQPAFNNISGNFTLAQFPSMAANTTLTNATSGSSVPTAFAMPSCSASGSALNWTTSTGFGCSSLWASPAFTTQVFLPAGTSTTPGMTFTGDTGVGFYNIAASHIIGVHTGTDADLWIRANPAGTVNLECANDAAGADVPCNIVGSTVAIKGGFVAITSGKTFTLNNSITFAAGADGITETMPATSFTTARTDAAQTFTGVQSFSSNPIDTAQALTAGTMTVTNNANMLTTTTRFDWTNAMVTALGGVTAGDIVVCTLPAKTVVKNMYVVIDTPDTSTNALTVAVGRTSAAFIDYIVASDAKAAANTVYGDASGERGTNLVGYDLPSVTGTTAIKAHFIKTTTNLSTVLGSTGHIYIETAILP